MNDCSNFTFEPPIYFIPIQRTFGFIAIPISILALYLIIFQSPKPMKNFKYYLLVMQVNSAKYSNFTVTKFKITSFCADFSFNFLGNFTVYLPGNWIETLRYYF